MGHRKRRFTTYMYIRSHNPTIHTVTKREILQHTSRIYGYNQSKIIYTFYFEWDMPLPANIDKSGVIYLYLLSGPL